MLLLMFVVMMRPAPEDRAAGQKRRRLQRLLPVEGVVMVSVSRESMAGMRWRGLLIYSTTTGGVFHHAYDDSLTRPASALVGYAPS